MVAVEVRAVAPPEDPVVAFARRVAAYCRPHARVLEVGAGAHDSGDLLPLLARHPHLVAIDPDESVLRNPAAHERLVTDVERYAEDGPAPFDVVFAVYVLEHVADPESFARACRSLLRPGGSLLALTLNVQHYFGATTWALSRLHVEERVLHRLVGANGHAHHHHHVRTEYRLNSARSLARTAEAAGFSRLELDCFDATANYAWYLPHGTRWLAPAWTRAVYAAGRPSLMGHLSVRLVR